MVKVEDHGKLWSSHNEEEHADPQSRRVQLRFEHRLWFRAAALVVFSSLVMSAAFVTLAFFPR